MRGIFEERNANAAIGLFPLALAEQETQSGSMNSPPSSPDTLSEEEVSVSNDDLIFGLENQFADLDSQNQESLGETRQRADYISSIEQRLENSDHQLEIQRDAYQDLNLELETAKERLEMVKEELKLTKDQLQGAQIIMRGNPDQAAQFDAVSTLR